MNFHYGFIAWSSVTQTLNGYALFGAGYQTQVTNKYNFTSLVLTTGTNLVNGGHYYAAAVGNYSVGVFGGSGAYGKYYLSYTEVYTYSNDTDVAGANLGVARGQLGAVGDNSNGYFAGGMVDSSNYTNYIDKYNYAGNTTSSGSTLYNKCGGVSACGNQNYGIFAEGWVTTYAATTEQYTYASSSITGWGTNLGLARWGASGFGSTSIGVFRGGNSSGGTSSYTDRYTYASSSVTSGVNLNNGGGAAGASASNYQRGFTGGSSSTSIDIYDITGNTTSSGSNLTVNTYGWGATSTAPGGF
jgi:hypothetical protein